MNVIQRRKAVDEVVGTIGSPSETKGMVRNEAAKRIEHLLGEDAANEFGDTLDAFKRNPEQYSLVYKDGGLRMRGIMGFSEKGRVTEFPKDSEQMFTEFEQYMNYCYNLLIPPSIVTLAVWLGLNRQDYDKRMEEYAIKKPDLANCMKLCKETLHGFLEASAIDGNIAPAVYLHQNKAYYDAVESVEIKHNNITDAHVRDESQIQEVIDMLPSEVKHKIDKSEG